MRTRIAALVVSALIVFVSVSAQSPSVTGEVTFREKIALPSTALLEVTLEDVSRAGSAGEVVSRLTQRTPSGSPIPFDLPFDPARIDPRSRYAVRAEIRDGRRVLFTSADHVLVVTQGRGAKVAIPLRMVNAPLKRTPEPTAATPPRSTPAPAVPIAPLRALPPVVELRNLPATFTGTLACTDCAGIKYELNLFPNDSFFLRTTRLGQPASEVVDDLGSWVLSSDRRVLVLKTARGTIERFAVRDGGRLLRLGATGQEAAAKTPPELRRAAAFTVLPIRGTFTGAVTAENGATRFVECSTGQTWPVAAEGARDAVNAAYQAAGRRLGAPVIVTVRGRLENRKLADRGTAESVFVTELLDGVDRTGSCATRFAALPLENTRWVLSALGATPVTQTAASSSLVFRGESGTFSGAGGCQQMTGRFRTGGEALSITPTGTMKACRAGESPDPAFSQAIGGARRYRIAGTVLELYDAEQQVLARFEGK